MFLPQPKYREKIILLCLITFLPALLVGCWNYRDLEELSILSGIGIDLDEKGKISLTAQIINSSALKTGDSGGVPGEANQMVRVATSTGDTVFHALRNFIPQASRRLYLAHMQILVIGDEPAKKGISPFIDFFGRDHESRPGIRVLISREKSGDILRSADGVESIPATGISRAVHAAGRNGFVPNVSLQDFINRLMSPTTSPVAPLMEVYEEKGFDGKVTKRVRTAGTAVFKKDKLVGELGIGETRGLCWILGEIESSIVTFQSQGAKGAFEVTKSTSQIKGSLVQGHPLITVQIFAQGNFGEEQGFAPLTLSEDISTLEEKISAQISREILASVAQAQHLETDIFGFGEVIHRSYPKEWKELEPQWQEIFPTLEVTVQVETEINEVGMTNQPFFQPEGRKDE